MCRPAASLIAAAAVATVSSFRRDVDSLYRGSSRTLDHQRGELRDIRNRDLLQTTRRPGKASAIDPLRCRLPSSPRRKFSMKKTGATIVNARRTVVSPLDLGTCCRNVECRSPRSRRHRGIDEVRDPRSTLRERC